MRLDVITAGTATATANMAGGAVGVRATMRKGSDG